VVPHFGGVLMTISSGRNVKPSQRALSVRWVRYLTEWPDTSPIVVLRGVLQSHRPQSAARRLRHAVVDETEFVSLAFFDNTEAIWAFTGTGQETAVLLPARCAAGLIYPPKRRGP
jgi:hypothetical protein